MNRDRLNLVLTAVGVLAVIAGCVLFPFFRWIALGLIVAVPLLIVSLIIIVGVLLNIGVRGPRSLSGRRCPRCGKRRALREYNRVFLYGNAKFPFDHFNVIYRCRYCEQIQVQEEHAVHPHSYSTDRVAVKVLIPGGSWQRYADDLAGKTVGFVRNELEEEERLAYPLSALVNGQGVTDEYVLTRGELLEFVRAGDAVSASEQDSELA
ncbi:hypothetical protein Pan153_02220 [Gimesia panareensis]|uniref:Uncharacterized protein n=1 Tax=Gimesia panareensis TaxID=2527978 RepID=A0A518FGZ0_9PLAN|nr:hypothetical protein [Gimesia panareensis]QDV15606.1 hypothetical protein Pan153_02220 [Gimesia panareensis]